MNFDCKFYFIISLDCIPKFDLFQKYDKLMDNCGIKSRVDCISLQKRDVIIIISLID